MTRTCSYVVACVLALAASALVAPSADAVPTSGLRITRALIPGSSNVSAVLEGRSFAAPGRTVVSQNADRSLVTFQEESLTAGTSPTPSMFVDAADASCDPHDGALTLTVTCPTSSYYRYIVLNLRDNTQAGREVLFRTSEWETATDTSIHVPMRVIGGPGIDQVRAFSSGDHIEGGSSNDLLSAHAPNITLIGGAGEDVLGPESDGVTVLAADGEKDRVSCSPTTVFHLSIDEGLDELLGCDSAQYLPSLTSRPGVSGTPRVDVALTASTGSWTRGASATAVTWLSCVTSVGDECVVRSGPASTRTFKPVKADVGRYIVARVSATNAIGSAFADSIALGPVAAALSNTWRPSISGLTIEGQRITFHRGAWNGSATTAYHYTVRNCRVNPNGTVGTCRVSASGQMRRSTATYKLTANDVGRSMQVQITASDSGASRSATSRRTSPVQELASVTVPATWQPRMRNDGSWSFVHVNDAAVDSWAALGERLLGVSVVYRRVGLAQVTTTKAWRKYRDDIPLHNGAILDVTPDFGTRIKGHPLLSAPSVVTITHYDAMLDLARCPVTGTSALRAMLVNQPLANAEAKLDALDCAVSITWSTAAPTDSVHMVDAVQVVTSGTGSRLTRTVVLTVRAPKLGGVALAVAPPRASDVAQLPDSPTLRLDGTLPAFPGSAVFTSLALWPVHAASGLTVEPPSSTSAQARVALYDTTGRRVYNAVVGQQIWRSKALLVSAALRKAGVVRVVFSVTDRDRRTIEVYANINVRTAIESFITVDGRCFTSSGAPTTSCPATPSVGDALASQLRVTGLATELTGLSSREALWIASATYDHRFTALVANGTLAVKTGVTPLAACQWFDVFCWGGKFVEGVVWLENHPPARRPEPAIALPLLEKALVLPPGATAPGIADQTGCVRLSALAGVGCLGGTLDPSITSMSIRSLVNAGLINLDGGTLVSLEASGLINLDGGTLQNRVAAGLINLDGGTLQRLTKAGLINLDGGTLRVAGPSLMTQPANRLAFSLSLPQ